MSERTRPVRTVIMGAAGRDFHNFNVLYRDDPAVEVVAFTANQIPGITERRYPAELAGPRYPNGIPIEDEIELEDLCRREKVDQVAFAYSDITHQDVMHAASRSLAAGADFVLAGPGSTMLQSRKPVIAVTAIRTGCGKSQTARYVSRRLRDRGVRVAVLRHPMPYGDLVAQRVQRFASLEDLDDAACTNEEREEYEPHIAAGGVVFAGVDYAAILAAAEAEADMVIWDGGNNDFSFVRPDLHIVLADALRPGQAASYHPGEAVLRMADVVVVNKVDAAPETDVEHVISEIRGINGSATIVRAASPARADSPDAVRGRRVLVVEDGPTITHGGLPYGAGYVAATEAGVAEIVDPRRSAPPDMMAVYRQYPHIGPVLPDIGYQENQMEALKQTIEGSDADAVLVAAPIDLGAVISVDKPIIRVRYEYEDAGDPTLGELLDNFLTGIELE